MSQDYPPRPSATSRIRVVLLAAWFAMTVAIVGFAFTVGTNSPNADEWEFVPAVTGHEPLGPWLWAQHNEHRLPLPRLAYYGLFQLTHDFRAGMFLQITMLSTLSLVLMRLAARLRGRPYWTDVFFPASLLHAGNWENLLLGYNICFATILVLETFLGLIALFATRDSLFRSGLAAGTSMVMLCLCGGGGVVTALPVTAWLAYLAICVWRNGATRRAVLLLAFAAFPAVYLAIYLDGYQRPGHHPPLAYGGPEVALATGQVLAMAFGFGIAKSWVLICAIVLLVGGITLGALTRDLTRDAARPAALGLLAVIAGIVGVALVIAMGRAGFGSKMGLASRYGYIVWPLLGLAYVFWVNRGGRIGKWVPAGLCAITALAYPANTITGMHLGLGIRSVLAAVEIEAAEGQPPERIVRHFPDTFQAYQEARAVRAIPMLREAGVGMYAGQSPDVNLWRVAAVLGGLVLFGFGARWLLHLGRAVQVERARELFRLQHERFEQMLLAAAAATGKPRGLTWVGCEIIGDAVLAHDGIRDIVALVPVVIHFEPVAGSDMEDVPAAREPRTATAVFTFDRGTWRTVGRIVFNLNPAQALAHFDAHWTIIEAHH